MRLSPTFTCIGLDITKPWSSCTPTSSGELLSECFCGNTGTSFAGSSLKCVSSPRLFPLQEPGLNSEATPLTKEEVEVKRKKKNDPRAYFQQRFQTKHLPSSTSVFSETPPQRTIFSNPTCSCWTSTESTYPTRKRGKLREPHTGKSAFETSTRKCGLGSVCFFIYHIFAL